MNYTDYLASKKLSPSTIHTYSKYSQKFTSWLAADNLTAQTFTYSDLLAYMQYCSEQGITKGSVHGILNVIRHYCNYLIAEKKRTDNPAAGVFIKGLVRKIPVHILSMEILEQLYQQYSIQLSVDASKKIMLGLLIYQALTVDEIIRLQKQHIKLNEGKILVKVTKRTNERWLSLQAVQIPALQGYLAGNKFKEGPVFAEQKKGAISPQNISNRVQWMFKQLRQLNPGVINAQQIRSSVLTHWLKKNSLREVQYMAGHKYVSSTERYQVNNLDDLQNELQQHHPLK
jgi:site-specific recombinase XerD